jgi:hypothetical protein
MKVNKQTNSEKTLFVGTGLITPLIFSPSRSELDKVLGIERDADYEEKPEFEYVKEDQEIKIKKINEDGEEIEDVIYAKKLNVTVWVKEIKTDAIFPINFYLEDRLENISKEKGLTKFINQFGKSSYALNENSLDNKFTNTLGKKTIPISFKKAKKGEAELLNFLAIWTNITPWDANNSLFVENEKKFWNGDMSELNNLIADFEDSSVMANFEITSKVDDDKEYQKISNQAFCPQSYMKFFRFYSKNGWEALYEKDNEGKCIVDKYNNKLKIDNVSMYSLTNYMNNIFGEYGTKGFSKKVEIEEYISEENPLNSEKSLVEESVGEEFDLF